MMIVCLFGWLLCLFNCGCLGYLCCRDARCLLCLGVLGVVELIWWCLLYKFVFGNFVFVLLDCVIVGCWFAVGVLGLLD